MLNITITEDQLKTIYGTFQKDYEITTTISLYTSEDGHRKIDIYAVHVPSQSSIIFVKFYNARYYENAKLPAATNFILNNLNTETYDAFVSSINASLVSEESKATLSEKYRMIMLIEDEDDEDINLTTYAM